MNLQENHPSSHIAIEPCGPLPTWKQHHSSAAAVSLRCRENGGETQVLRTLGILLCGRYSKPKPIKTIPICSMYGYIYFQNWVIWFGHMLVNIPAPWCTWDMPKKKQGTGFFCLVSSTVAQEMIRIAPITRWMVDPTFEQVMATGVKVSLLMGYVVIHRTVKKIEI